MARGRTNGKSGPRIADETEGADFDVGGSRACGN